MDPNLWNVRITMRVPSYYEVHRMFYFNLYGMNNDEEMRYVWTIPPHHAKKGIHILVEFEHIQQQSIPITHDRNTTTLSEHITAVTQMVSDEPSMLYSTVNNDEDEVEGSDGDDVVLVNLNRMMTMTRKKKITENIVPQWDSSQCSTRYDYTYSGTFLDMGLGSPIDDPVESGTVRLLNWNDSMTDIHCGKWQTYTLPCSHVLAVCRENGLRTDTYVPEIYLRQMYRRTYRANFHPVLSENFWRGVPVNLTFYPPNMKKERGRKSGKQFQGKWIIEIRILSQDMANVACRDIIEKIVITPDLAMYKFVN
ncbi:hypothetical protein M9H77_28027 [Catharanthus roseus]|uniref:Uncharacterized protein n=1 Tax=Catharanthus roseus TaxID=4058 RepID=A0ACC0AGD7_CATRO|nr:hypothetical protein M9H77_28027 [Catharanthus roseus]